MIMYKSCDSLWVKNNISEKKVDYGTHVIYAEREYTPLEIYQKYMFVSHEYGV